MKKIMKKILETKLILEEVKKNLGYSYVLFMGTGIFCLLRSFCARLLQSESQFMGMQVLWLWITCSDNAANAEFLKEAR